jgi:hypothetical protein
MKNDSDEAVMASIPIGYRTSLIGIAMAKRWLSRDDVSVADRLHHLEFVKSQAFGSLTAQSVAAVEPASDQFEQAFTDAMQADSGETQCATAFGILARDDAFLNLVKLNPSLIRAIKLCKRHAA